MKIKKRDFGILSTGQTAHLYILKNDSMVVAITDYGAILASVLLPSARNEWDDVVLGYSTLAGYTERHPYFGATVGRYANRIASARFSLDGREYELAANDGKNHIHGGWKGFDTVLWEAEPWEDRESVNVRLFHRSPDGNEGYPGNLDVEVTYSLSVENGLKISYEAQTDAPTPVNLTNHSYFNLKGEGRGDILDHEVQLFCPRFVAVDSHLIPTGELKDVAGTPFDFSARKPIRRDYEKAGGGYDQCFVIDRGDAAVGESALCAEVEEPVTGRELRVRTTLPGVQFYTGNHLGGVRGKRGSIYDKHSGFCLETGFYPDSPNRSEFPSSILKPGESYSHSTLYEFSF